MRYTPAGTVQNSPAVGDLAGPSPAAHGAAAAAQAPPRAQTSGAPRARSATAAAGASASASATAAPGASASGTAAATATATAAVATAGAASAAPARRAAASARHPQTHGARPRRAVLRGTGERPGRPPTPGHQSAASACAFPQAGLRACLRGTARDTARCVRWRSRAAACADAPGGSCPWVLSVAARMCCRCGAGRTHRAGTGRAARRLLPNQGRPALRGGARAQVAAQEARRRARAQPLARPRAPPPAQLQQQQSPEQQQQQQPLAHAA
jgi:hypothetical protein